MLSLLHQATTVYREHGLRELSQRSIQYIYNNGIRPHLPRTTVEYNGVKVRAARVGDCILPWQTTDIPTYEDALVSGIRAHVEENDTVVVVGGGWGVSTVAAAVKTGKSGQVITYEGSEDEVCKVRETAQLNGVEGHCEIRHAIIGQAKSLRGNQGQASILPPNELPECDILILDCEGAENMILDGMVIRPRVTIVESHGMLGASKKDVKKRLEQQGYEVTNRGVAEPHLRETCIRNGVYVLSGTQFKNS